MFPAHISNFALKNTIEIFDDDHIQFVHLPLPENFGKRVVHTEYYSLSVEYNTDEVFIRIKQVKIPQLPFHYDWEGHCKERSTPCTSTTTHTALK